MKRARTYRALADGCGAGAGRVATTGPHRATTSMQRTTMGPHCPTTGLQRATTDRQLVTTGPQRAMTGTGVKKETGNNGYATPDDRYRVGQRRVCASDDGYATPDNGYRVGRRRVLLVRRQRRLRDNG